MSRKTRLWRCDPCHLIYHRKKGDNTTTTFTIQTPLFSSQQVTRPCARCGKPMKAARVWPTHEWFEIGRRRRDRQKAKALQERRRWSKPRDVTKRRLKLTPDAKRAWRRIARAKTLATMKRWAPRFVDAVYYSANGQVTNGVRYVPKVVFHREKPQGTFGEYVRAPLRGVHEIRLWRRHLEQMKMTFLHEVMHYLDALADTPSRHDNHGLTWNERLNRFKHDLGASGRRYLSEHEVEQRLKEEADAQSRA